jgi:iron only hydrogenase large subunit-like protein
MISSLHSVRLNQDLCIGCTNCIKSCPTEAIRVRNKKANIIESKCIDCGECIRKCPEHAKKSVTSSLLEIDKYKYKIALPAPSLYSQFGKNADIGKILMSLKNCGFDHVFEVSKAADIVSDFTRDYIETSEITPVISSSCPVVVRLIQIKFPNLIPNLLPFNPPVEVAAKAARNNAMRDHGLKAEDIGIFFISPCPAKVTTLKNPIGIEKSNIDGMISFTEIFPHIIKNMSEEKLPFYFSGKGIGWAKSGGETSSLRINDYICVDGIENVINILHDIEEERLSAIQFAELLSCKNGCVGGVLTIENPFIARSIIRQFTENYKDSEQSNSCGLKPEDTEFTKPIKKKCVNLFGKDIKVALEKMNEVKEIKKKLPSLDCGACGSPSCQVMAEDIVLGETTLNDCMVLFKEQFEKNDKE